MQKLAITCSNDRHRWWYALLMLLFYMFHIINKALIICIIYMLNYPALLSFRKRESRCQSVDESSYLVWIKLQHPFPTLLTSRPSVDPGLFPSALESIAVFFTFTNLAYQWRVFPRRTILSRVGKIFRALSEMNARTPRMAMRNTTRICDVFCRCLLCNCGMCTAENYIFLLIHKWYKWLDCNVGKVPSILSFF